MGRGILVVGLVVTGVLFALSCKDGPTNASPTAAVPSALDAAPDPASVLASQADLMLAQFASATSADQFSAKNSLIHDLCASYEGASAQHARLGSRFNLLPALCSASVASTSFLETPAPTAPTSPDKPTYEAPTYEKPTYSGAHYLEGEIRGRYNGSEGVVLQSGGTLYVIDGAEMPNSPFITELNGYVEDTGRTATLDLGRNGREAAIVKISSIETYRDDQREYQANVAEAQTTYRAAVADAQKTYRDALTTYNDALRSLPARKKDYAAAVAAREAQATELEKSFSAALVAFALSFGSKSLSAAVTIIDRTSAPLPSSAPVLAQTTTRLSPAAAPAAAPAAKNCDPNYTLDSDGRKHFKPECFR